MKGAFRNALCAAAAGVALGADVFPITWPFENESFTPDDPNAGTPDFSFAPETDPGGYVYRGNWKLEVLGGTVTDMPHCAHMTQFSMWALVQVYGAPPQLPANSWNCTAKDLAFTEADFTGEVNSVKYCNVGECCKDLLGLGKYGDDQMSWHSWASDRAASGLCDAIAFEKQYCIEVGGHFQTNCYEYFTTPTERIYTMLCIDHFVRYWLNCPVFKQAYSYTYADGAQDSSTYQKDCTISQAMTADTNFLNHDRICEPYSYYYPDDAGVAEDKKKEDSSVGIQAFVVALAIALL